MSLCVCALATHIIIDFMFALDMEHIILWLKNNVMSFCVTVLLMRQGQAQEGLGEEMYEAFKNGEEIPQADVEITDDDTPEVQRMKELIVEMTAYEASDRPTIQQVLAVLAELNDQVRHARSL